MSEAKPTVVLVHGAFADASSWNGVIPRLLAKGLSVTAPPNPLRGIEADSAYIAAVLQQIEGPILAVGHSYGGAVITNAATDVKNVVGLVYVAAFAPDQGEILGEASADSKDSVLNSALVPRQYPTGDGGSRTEFSIAPAKVREAFASDLSDEDSRTHRNHAAARLRARILGLLGPAGVEGSPVVGRRRDRRQGARHRPGPLDGGAGRRQDHGSRGLPRDHDLAAAGRDRRDPGGRGGRRIRRRSSLNRHQRPRGLFEASLPDRRKARNRGPFAFSGQRRTDHAARRGSRRAEGRPDEFGVEARGNLPERVDVDRGRRRHPGPFRRAARRRGRSPRRRPARRS